MKKILFLLLISLPAIGQNYIIKGTLLDTASVPIEFATVMLLNPADSAMISFHRTNLSGRFEFKNLKMSMPK